MLRYLIVLLVLAGCDLTTEPLIVVLPDTLESFRYASSIDPIPDLYARCRASRTDAPVVILMHGFAQQASAFQPEVFERLSREGVTVCALGMRGRDGASGTPDANGRELQDIIDGLAEIRRRYQTNAPTAIVGFSGGGANALAIGANYPDAFQVVVSYFGISDFRLWYETVPEYRSTIVYFIGGTPAELPEAYDKRDFRPGLMSYPGSLFLFHDTEDPTVPVTHTQRLADIPGVTVHISGPGDTPRFIHGLPADTAPMQSLWLRTLVAH